MSRSPAESPPKKPWSEKTALERGVYPVGAEQFLAFGVIVQQFARFERLVEVVINEQVKGRHVALTALAISSLSYSSKCDVVKSLTHVNFPDGDNAIVAAFLGSFNTHSGLRNNIAHAIWTEGTRP